MNIDPDFIFETSWEVCNKIGGIYTVLSTKAKSITEQFNNNYILIGPDVWRNTNENPDFLEDQNMFKAWKSTLGTDGLKIRTGRWNIEGKPMVILVDFTPFFAKKDEIFAKFWETYKLDSLHGGWDYIEAAIFGYAAGKVIQSFSNHELSDNKNVVAHFHEWMTGSGVLQLKHEAPEISTVFTTHATVVGRSIAGNGFPLYDNIEQYNALKVAEDFNVRSKHSLESISAQQADVLTTVSDITAIECIQFFGVEPHVITTNGFEKDFVPKANKFTSKRKVARDKALEIASQHTGATYDDNTALIITSGRYEFINKGIDLYIKALADTSKKTKRRLVAYITVPAGHYDIVTPVNGKFSGNGCILTHNLHDPQNDPVMKLLNQYNIKNNPDDNLHIIFAPVYLNGNDGVINLKYYDFLIGFDISVFPSYYEPWGYTPLESIAFKIPTITTNFAGFGAWVKTNFKLKSNSVSVVERRDGESESSVKQISNILSDLFSNTKLAAAQKETTKVLKKALWSEMVDNYFKSWSLSVYHSSKRKIELPEKKYIETQKIEAHLRTDNPEWKKILVQNKLPNELQPLKEMAYNLWWSWNYKAQDLFNMINPEYWKKIEYNPVKLIESLSQDDIDRLLSDSPFMSKLDVVYSEFNAYMKEAENRTDDMISYFSMEYGLHNSLKIFSGGLGILAGDYLKQASDSNKNLVAVGLLYRYGYFKQEISIFGDQKAISKAQKFTELPLIPVREENGDWKTIAIGFPGRRVLAKVWKVNVGRVPLYLLDTDIEANSVEDRGLTAQLYGGNNEHRLKQEILLGIGGIRLLYGIGLSPKVFHSNEGHSAFSGLERIKKLMKDHSIDFKIAKELVRANTLFTTHTPVPAGHDSFEEHLMRAYLSHYADIFSISWEEFMALGRHNIQNHGEKFSMSLLATQLSQEVNGVSKIHGRVSREMFKSLYPGYFTEEIHIGHVTNGVHYFTWTDKEWQKLYNATFDSDFSRHQSDSTKWQRIFDIPDHDIWQTRLKLKANLISAIKEKLRNDLTKRQETPSIILETMSNLNNDTLIVGFARRFATYKRAHLLFTNIERLSKIVNNPNKPVIFIFSGKAHPHDKAGQDLIKKIIDISKQREFIGKILFLENYDMIIGKLLTSSVDIWLNTPTRPLEASGTSGEKAIMNGVANFSVLDGWWAEGYKPEAGWAIEESKTYANQAFQDELDAQIIYNTFENEIVKSYYDKNNEGVSSSWTSFIKNTIANVAPHFTMQRMLEDYYRLFYNPLFERQEHMYKNDFENARNLVVWKDNIRRNWENISVELLEIPDADNKPLEFGKQFVAKVGLKLPGISPSDIGVEIVMGNKVNDTVERLSLKYDLEYIKSEADLEIFSCEFPLEHTGVYDYAFRIYPKNKDLRYRMDFPLVKWV